MTNVIIAGTASGATALPVANSIDGSADYIPIYTASATATQAINRNTFLNITSGPVGLTDSQTLTNKVLTSPTINGATLSGTLSGTYTIGGTPTFPSSVVTLTGSQTLTNKVLTAPTISAPTITNATISADAVTGFTVSNTGTFYGVSVTTGVINGSGTIGSSALQTNAVQAAQLAQNAITLGYAQINSGSFTTASTSAVQVTGLTTTVTIPSGGRRVKITVYGQYISNTTSGDGVTLAIWDGTVGSGTLLASSNFLTASAGQYAPAICIAVVSPSAGSKTYNAALNAVTGGTASLANGTNTPAFILVEAI